MLRYVARSIITPFLGFQMMGGVRITGLVLLVVVLIGFGFGYLFWG